MHFSNVVEHRVTDLQNREQEKDEEMDKRKAFLNLQAWVSERLGRGAWDARPDVVDDGPVSFREIMPPKMMKRKAINKMVKKQIAEAIEEHKRTRVDLGNASGSGKANTGGPVTAQEQVFEICKCAEEDKVMFAVSIFKGHALTWWNGNVHTLGLVNANRIPWTEFKSMITTEYCPATEIQRMEEELWTLTLKGDDIEAYNNRFHELALMCPDLGFPERIKGNITSARPTTLHEAVNLAQELVEQVRLGHIEADCKTRLPGTDENPIRNVTYYGCGEKGHLRNLRPKGKNQRNEGARARAYVVVENL
nr:hypothetical protein [Tanacetum cinerariifolium]